MGATQKRQNDLRLFPRQTIQPHGNQVCAPATSAKEDEGKRFYEDLPDLLEITAKKRDVLYIIGDWIAKIGGQKMEYYFGLKKEGNLRCLTDTEDLAK